MNGAGAGEDRASGAPPAPPLAMPRPTVPRLPRAALVQRILALEAPVTVIEAPAGMGKSWLLADLAAAAPGAILWDVPHVAQAAPLPDPAPGARLILARRPATAIPGLARAQVYGRVATIPAADLLLTVADFRSVGLSGDEAEAALARTGGWPCLLPAILSGRAGQGALTDFLRDEVLAPLATPALAAFAVRLERPEARVDPRLLSGLPFQDPAEGPLHPALAATRAPMLRALRQTLAARAANPEEARAIATTQAALGRAPEAVATFQAAGAWQAALRTVQEAGGPFFVHSFGPDAFDRMLAGFPPDLLASDETLVLCRAIQAAKRGEIALTRRIMADRWGPGMADAATVMADGARHPLPVRFFRLLLRTWEDFDLPEGFLEDAFRILAELPPEDDLRRGSFHNAVLEFYIRVRRLPEAENVALRAAEHYARAGVPILSFYIDLHRAIIRLMLGEIAPARAHATAARRHLRAAEYDSPGDARLLALLDACIDFESGRPDRLSRFLSLDLDALEQGEVWPTLVELVLTYGSQALAETYGPLAARAFLDRWRVMQDRSSQFRTLIDIREVAILQSAGRWAEAADKARRLPGRVTQAFVLAEGAPLATLADRDEIAAALLWLRHLAQLAPQRPGLPDLIAALRDNPHLTARQRSHAAIWQAHVLRRQRRPAEAGSLLIRELARAVQSGATGHLTEERQLLGDLLSLRAIRAAVEAQDPLRRILPQLLAPGPARAAGLTRQETRMLRAIAEGAPNKAIANMLGLTERTVKFHLGNLYRKLGVPGRRAAVAAAAALGLIA